MAVLTGNRGKGTERGVVLVIGVNQDLLGLYSHLRVPLRL